jgi:hypothetical protein
MSWIVQPVQAPTRRSWNIAGIVNKLSQITIGLDVHHRQPMGESSKYCVWNLKRTAVNVNGYHPWFFFRTVQIISRLLPLGHGVRNMNFANRVGYMVTRAISTNTVANTVALQHDIQWCSGPRSVIIASYCCCVHVYTIRNLRWHTLTRGIPHRFVCHWKQTVTPTDSESVTWIMRHSPMKSETKTFWCGIIPLLLRWENFADVDSIALINILNSYSTFWHNILINILVQHRDQHLDQHRLIKMLIQKWRCWSNMLIKMLIQYVDPKIIGCWSKLA